MLLVALAMFGGGLFLEALGAFGYTEDPLGEANDLAVLHDIGVVVWSSGFVLVAAGILTVAVTIADRRGAGQSKLLATAVAPAILVVVAFEVGALVFGY